MDIYFPWSIQLALWLDVQIPSFILSTTVTGTIHSIYDAVVEIRFNRFWVDFGEDKLRQEIVGGPQGSQDGTYYFYVVDCSCVCVRSGGVVCYRLMCKVKDSQNLVCL